MVRGYLPQPAKVAQDIQAQLADIGIKVKIDVKESGAFLQAVAAGSESMFMLGWGADYPDATNFYDFHFAADSKRFGTEYPDLVKAIKEAAALADPAARQKVYDQVNVLVKQHVPMIPVAHGGNAKLVGKNLTGMKDSEGNPFFQMLLDVAKTKGKGWVEGYKFLNPVSQKIEGKAMYLERVGDTLVGCGIYKG